jgi:serine/threonine protein kinase
MFEETVKVFDNHKKTERGNFGSFEKIEVPNPEEFVEQHDRIIGNLDFFVGKGNNAVVYDTTLEDENGRSRSCVKAMWRSLSAEISEKRFSELPEVAKPLRKIQDYFEHVKEKKRKFIKKGFDFRPQVNPETEARYSNRANILLKESGSDVTIPWVTRIIELKRGDKNYDTDPRYYWEEDVTLLHMEKVQGENIEKIILELDEKGIAPKINFEEFSSKLREAISIFHSKGLYHNDLSTRNIMVREDGQPVIIDFGAGHQGFEGQANEQMYQDNLKDLEKTLNWLRKYLDNPEKTNDELQDYLDKLEE